MATTRRDIQDATGRAEFLAGVGWMRAYGTKDQPTPTDGQAGFGPGCLWQNPYAAALSGTALYVNVGTSAVSNWLNIA